MAGYVYIIQSGNLKLLSDLGAILAIKTTQGEYFVGVGPCINNGTAKAISAFFGEIEVEE